MVQYDVDVPWNSLLLCPVNVTSVPISINGFEGVDLHNLVHVNPHQYHMTVGVKLIAPINSQIGGRSTEG